MLSIADLEQLQAYYTGRTITAVLYRLDASGQRAIRFELDNGTNLDLSADDLTIKMPQSSGDHHITPKTGALHAKPGRVN